VTLLCKLQVDRTAALQPVSDRTQLLDVLRGTAIFGILLFNIGSLSGHAFIRPEIARTLPGASADSALQFLIVLFIEGKFYSLFSFLFGVGFAVLLERCLQRGVDPAALLRRRYFGLLVIGLVHTILIWFGDILVLYSLLGFLLLVFRKKTDRTLLIAAAILLLVPIVVYAIILTTRAESGSGANSGPPPQLMHAIASFRSGGYIQVIAGNALFSAGNWVRRFYLMFYPRVFAMFLIGFVIGRRNILRRPSEHVSLIRSCLRVGLVVGVVASAGYALLDQHQGFTAFTQLGLLRTICESIGTPTLTMGYVAAITLLFERAQCRRWLLIVEPVGRAALSNYLLQSIVCIAMFYGIGGGLFMRVSLGTALAMAAMLFVLQLGVSRLWFSRFSFGPVEWIWRQFTYQTRVPLRRSPAVNHP
jgi:uncharacterized protein